MSCVQNDVRPCTDASGMGWGATIKAKDTRGARRCCPANAKAKCGLWTQHFPKQTENGEFGQPCCLAKLCVTGEISYVRGPFRSEDAWGDRSSAAVALPPRNTRRGTAVGPSESRLGKNKKNTRQSRTISKTRCRKLNDPRRVARRKESKSISMAIRLAHAPQSGPEGAAVAGAHLPRFPLSLDFRSLDRDLDLDLFAIGPFPHAASNQPRIKQGY